MFTEVLVTGFQLLESRAQRAMRENNAGQDLADLVFGRGGIAILILFENLFKPRQIHLCRRYR